MSKSVQPPGAAADQSSDSERRGERRHDAAKLGKVTARLIGGSEVSLVNFSNRGVLFESDSRLLIGARASVRITTTDANLVVTGRVVRSRVKGVVNGALRYDAALALDSELTLAVPEDPEPVAPDPEPVAAAEAAPPEEPEAEPDDAVEEWAQDGPTLDAEPAEYIPPQNDDAVVELFASVPHDLAELRRLAADNQW